MKTKNIQDERQERAKKFADNEAKLAEVTSAKLKLQTDSAKALKALDDEVRFLKAEMHDRGSNYVKMITQLQGFVKQAHKETTNVVNQTAEIDKQFKTVQQFASSLESKQGKPIAQWHEQTNGAMAALIEQNKHYKAEAEEAEDTRRNVEVEVEEEKAKNLMLEEQNSQLEHDVAIEKSKVEDAKKKAEERVERVNHEKDELLKQKKESDDKCKQLQDSKDQLLEQSRRLHGESQQAQAELSAHQADHEVKAGEFETKMAEFADANRVLESEKDRLAQERAELQEKLDKALGNNKNIGDAMRVADAKLQEAQAEQDKLRATAKKSIQQKDARLSMMSQQVEQTKKLLERANEARKELQNENEELRSELDTHHVSAISGGG